MSTGVPSHNSKYSVPSNSSMSKSGSIGSTTEPIYQNQAELREQLKLLDKREPIYQNLPAHEKLMHKNNSMGSGTPKIAAALSGDEDDTSSTTSKIKGHVSRVAITNSREDLSQHQQQHSEYIQPLASASSSTDSVDHRKKSVTKINILASGPSSPTQNNKKADTQKTGDDVQNPKNLVRNTSKDNFIEQMLSSSDIQDELHEQQQQQQQQQQVSQHASGAITTTAGDKSNSKPSVIHHEPVVTSIDPIDPFASKPKRPEKLVGEPIKQSGSGKANTPAKASPPKKPARSKAVSSQSVENIASLGLSTELDDASVDLSVTSGQMTPSGASSSSKSNNTPRTPSSKPRAGRKRWAFNFGGSKTGSLKSLKSIKSSGGDEDEDKK